VKSFARPRRDDKESRKSIKGKTVKLLYQNFFHGIFPAEMEVANVKGEENRVAMFVYFEFRELPKGSFINYLAGLIYNEAFKGL
jgi:hypothetical protein